jgi:hypothetical protein
MDIYGKAPKNQSGKYFRANVWSWRPIHNLCRTVLGQDLIGWGYNDGDGLHSQKECDALADKLKVYIQSLPGEEIILESLTRVDESGKFLRGHSGGKSAYFTNKDHVREFIVFLYNCGGFEIY